MNEENKKFLSNRTSREKCWKELTDAEKIERMRAVIHNLQYTVQNSNEQTHKFKNDFYVHKHDTQTGEIVKPLKEYDSHGGVLGTGASLRQKDNQDEVYF